MITIAEIARNMLLYRERFIAEHTAPVILEGILYLTQTAARQMLTQQLLRRCQFLRQKSR